MKTLLLEQEGPIAVVRMNRPDVLNALDTQALEELVILMDLITKGKQIKVLIITGVDEKAFIAGADIKAMQKMTHVQLIDFLDLGQKVSNAFENAPFVTIAAVNGYALGGGFEVALGCDFIYAGTNAKFGLPEVTLGIIPGFGGTQRLSRAIGTRLAKEMIMTAKIIGAEEAKSLGIVNEIYQPELLLQQAKEAAGRIVQYSSLALRQAKKAIQCGSSLSFEDGLELEKNMCTVCFDTPERIRAMAEFVQKRGKR